MDKNAINQKSAYAGDCIMLTTKHAKSIAIAPIFLEKLGASVIEYVVDTDQLGTFSGEVPREGNALECAHRKCQWAFDKLEGKIKFALASEGSFGPHPLIPFVPVDQEILYFIDYKRNFHLHLLYVSEKTNYRMQSVETFEQLEKFAQETLFPSHALILRPNSNQDNSPLFKGINTLTNLEVAFSECREYSADGKVWVETDMRAHFNPSRMKVIAELADKLAEQLRTHCPQCDTPGWGKVRQEKGLKCSDCGLPTELVKWEILGCPQCDYFIKAERSDGQQSADPANCQYCNP